MLDRESTFANPVIVNFLKTYTVPVAIDQAYQRRQKDTEGDFYRKIVQQSPRKNNGNATTQGLYLAAADGTFLGFTNNRHPDRVIAMLKTGLESRDRQNAAPVEQQTIDRQYNPQLPDGGLNIRVQAKILSGYDEPDTKFQHIFQTALSRDNLWVTKAEHRQLAAGRFPDSLATRISRFHLVDNTRGEPPMWETSEIVSQSFSIDGEKVSGHVELKTTSGDRWYSVDLLGELLVADGKVTTWNMVAKGVFSGDGPYTRGAPDKPFPLAISFSIADGTDIADGIPPQGSRGWLDGYLR